MGILEKIAEIEAEMARTQRNKVGMDLMLITIREGASWHHHIAYNVIRRQDREFGPYSHISLVWAAQ